MNFTKTYTDMLKETFFWKGFAGLNLALRVLCVIALLPFMLWYAIGMLVYGIGLLLFKLGDVPYEYLHATIKAERQEVRHATEAIIYFVAFPTLFFLKVLMSFLIVMLVVIHFCTSIIGYVATFGGLTLSPYIFTEVDRSDKTPNPHKTPAVIVFVTLALTFLMIMLVLFLIGNAIATFTTWEEWYSHYEDVYWSLMNAIDVLWAIYTYSGILYILIYGAVKKYVCGISEPVIPAETQD